VDARFFLAQILFFWLEWSDSRDLTDDIWLFSNRNVPHDPFDLVHYGRQDL
jgi:hypothetical protein